MVINQKHVHHISSEFFYALTNLQGSFVEHEGQMCLSQVNRTVLMPSEIANFTDRLLKIYKTTLEAIDAF